MKDCLFCKLSKTVTIRFQNEELFVVDDINPQAPIHQLIIPKRHIPTVNHVREEESGLLGRLVYRAQQQAIYHNIHETGFRTVFNCNQDGGQSIDHIHLHLLGGRLLKWPPG